MKTLLIISHPDYLNSTGQRFLTESRQPFETVTSNHLDSCYPDGRIDVEAECHLLKSHDRIILQFPLYWYSSPSLLKEWQDQVFSRLNTTDLEGKEFGIVLSVGVAEKGYRAGGKIGLTLDQILSPFQAVATYFEMTYLPHFAIYQFNYMTEEMKGKLLVSYQYYLTGPKEGTLEQRTTWFVEQLESMAHIDRPKVDLVIEGVTTHQETLIELADTLTEMAGDN